MVMNMIGKLKGIADSSVKKENYRKALDAVTAASFILEEWISSMLMMISR